MPLVELYERFRTKDEATRLCVRARNVSTHLSVIECPLTNTLIDFHDVHVRNGPVALSYEFVYPAAEIC